MYMSKYITYQKNVSVCVLFEVEVVNSGYTSWLNQS